MQSNRFALVVYDVGQYFAVQILDRIGWRLLVCIFHKYARTLLKLVHDRLVAVLLEDRNQALSGAGR